MTTKVSEPETQSEKTADPLALDKTPDVLPVVESHTQSEKLFERAQKICPGGVNSPVRSCKAVGGSPVFIRRGDGSTIVDVDSNQYLDYCCSWGALLFGHRYPRIQQALETALMHGTSFGAPTQLEVELAEQICRMMPSIEMVRMVNSGTEATMSAIRLARAFTKREIIIKFDGCYHGHGDSFLVKAGSGLATLGISSSPGVPDELAKLTVSLPYNDLGAVEKTFKEHKDKIAAVIVEPIAANAGLIMPEDGFLQGLRDVCTKHNALLIFDEVITGFRVAAGGAQAKYGVKPDLTTLGKAIGAGVPVGAYGGRKEIMEQVAPAGTVYQAGTLSGNPLAMAAGLAQLRSIEQLQPHARLAESTTKLANGLQEVARKAKVPLQVVHTTGLLCAFFSKHEVTDFASAQKADTQKFAHVWQSLLKHGVYWPPSQFESAFVSTEHSPRDIEHTISAFEQALNS